MNSLIKLLMISIAGAFLIIGCSPSSNSVRFKQKNDRTEKNTYSRFTSNESIKSSVSDSTNIDEISDDSDSEELPIESQSIDISSIVQKFNTKKDSKNVPAVNSIKEKMLMEIIKQLWW
jgi:hypothetical protein